MSAVAVLRCALGDAYRHSMRLVVLNCAVGAIVVVAAAGAAYALPAALLALAAGPLVAGLVYCSVVVVQSGDLAWRDAWTGLSQHWRWGLGFGALVAGVIALGVVAVRFYARAGLWPMAALSVYVLAAFCVWQLMVWPLAVAGVAHPFATATRALLRRPRAALGLAAALVVLNVLGAIAVIPVLTLTLAYSFLVTARFVLPLQEAQ